MNALRQAALVPLREQIVGTVRPAAPSALLPALRAAARIDPMIE